LAGFAAHDSLITLDEARCADPFTQTPEAVFAGDRRARALDHPELRRPLEASKPAGLVTVARRRSGEDDPLVSEAGRATAFLRDGRRRVAVMVNRVRTAV
jgi:hypothetical protein